LPKLLALEAWLASELNDTGVALPPNNAVQLSPPAKEAPQCWNGDLNPSSKMPVQNRNKEGRCFPDLHENGMSFGILHSEAIGALFTSSCAPDVYVEMG
jgi:hypothetical protein